MLLLREESYIPSQISLSFLYYTLTKSVGTGRKMGWLNEYTDHLIRPSRSDKPAFCLDKRDRPFADSISLRLEFPGVVGESRGSSGKAKNPRGHVCAFRTSSRGVLATLSLLLVSFRRDCAAAYRSTTNRIIRNWFRGSRSYK